MPMRVTRGWLSRAVCGLASGALALSLLSAGGSGAATTSVRSALADDIDCYNDKDLYNLPECVERRALDKKSGNQQNESQGAPLLGPEPQTGGGPQQSGGQQASGGSGQQSSGSDQQTGSGDQQTGSGDQQTGSGQQASNNQQQSSGDDDDDDKPAPPRAPLTDPAQAVLTVADAGKEATQYFNEAGTDKFGKWARTRFERDRANGSSALGPNVMYSKVWVANDDTAAKAVFTEQSAIKDFPERKEKVEGPVEKIKPTKYGEDFSFTSGFFQDDKVWQHWRIVMHTGKAVAVVYLFGREEFFQDTKDKGWTGQGDYFTSTVYNRMW